MSHLLSQLKMPLFAVIIGAAVGCVQAQDNSAAGGSSGEPIIFSQPGNASTAAPQSTDDSRSPTAPVAPQFFNSHLPTPSLQQNYQPSQSAPPDKNKTIWTLMTPAEILGVEMPDKALRSAQQKAYDEEHEGSTPLERFLKRQTDAQSMAATNGMGAQTFSGQWDFSRNDDQSRLPGESFSDRQKEDMNFLKNSLNDWSANPKKSGGQNSMAPKKLPAKTPNIEQMMTIQQFSKLLAPYQDQDASDDSAASSAAATAKINADKEPIVDPNLQPRPLFNPVGASYKPIESNISRPVGIQPLPTLTSPVLPTVAAPSWAPKPAPWHSQAPQPFAIPQRQF